ncbi:hypothetical protein XM25_07795 [Devosia sp. H5989]|nr:hypothetical protein XM25_07795 [Devosia sp. H5989]
MALTEPIDLLSGFPGWSTSFDLLWRQEQSRQASGRTRVKDLGSPLWWASYISRSLSPNELDYWRARLDVLENGLLTFTGYSLTRCFPIAYPMGSWPTGDDFDGVSATIHTLGANNKSLRVTDLPAGFQFSIGDMIQVTTATGKDYLFRVNEAALADGTGLTPTFEVRPHFPAGVSEGDTVSVKRPSIPMVLMPGSISSTADARTGRGTISFDAIEAR